MPAFSSLPGYILLYLTGGTKVEIIYLYLPIFISICPSIIINYFNEIFSYWQPSSFSVTEVTISKVKVLNKNHKLLFSKFFSVSTKATASKRIMSDQEWHVLLSYSACRFAMTLCIISASRRERWIMKKRKVLKSFLRTRVSIYMVYKLPGTVQELNKH